MLYLIFVRNKVKLKFGNISLFGQMILKELILYFLFFTLNSINYFKYQSRIQKF